MSGLRGPATLGRRAAAYLIDGAIATVISLVAAGALAGVSLGTGGGFPLAAAVSAAYVVTGAWFLVYTWMQAGAGSIGMRALGLRLAHMGDDASLGFGRALGRNVVWGLGAAIVVGMFSPLFDASPWRRGWHDRAAGAVMTDVAGRGVDIAAPPADAADAASTPPSLATQVPQAAPEAPTAVVQSAQIADAAAPLEETVIDRRPAVIPSPGAGSAGVISFVPGVSDPARPAAPSEPVARATAAPTIAPALIDPLEQTRLSVDRPFARLVWDDGGRQALYGRTLFGRNPSPETGAMVTPVRDETLSLSKTHFELVPDEDRTLWVIDRHSTNGVVVRRGTQRQQAVPGERTRVRMGDILEFGDRHVVIEVAP